MSTPAPDVRSNAFDAYRAREDFPILHQQIYGKPLVYLDNGATSQKPTAVIEAIKHYYERDNSNVHRGVHALSERATAAYEAARDTVASFLGGVDRHEVIFVRGGTEGINLVAQSYARTVLAEGDEVICSEMEHHSNIVPWQIVCEQTGAVLKVIPVTEEGELDLDAFQSLLGERTRLVAVPHVSNVLGTINPVSEIAALTHAVGAKLLLDGCQAVPHLTIDIPALDCDFYVFSSHKVYGPTGVGALWGRSELLEAMPPYQGGGEMIRIVSFDGTTYSDLPHKFEAGTPNIAGTVGLGAALEYVLGHGVGAIAAHEDDVLRYGTEALESIDGLRIIGKAPHKSGIMSFVIDDAHAHDVGTIVDSQGVAVRVGHHCAMPLHERFGLAATARASLALYNTREDIDALVEAIWKAKRMLSK